MLAFAFANRDVRSSVCMTHTIRPTFAFAHICTHTQTRTHAHTHTHTHTQTHEFSGRMKWLRSVCPRWTHCAEMPWSCGMWGGCLLWPCPHRYEPLCRWPSPHKLVLSFCARGHVHTGVCHFVGGHVHTSLFKLFFRRHVHTVQRLCAVPIMAMSTRVCATL